MRQGFFLRSEICLGQLRNLLKPSILPLDSANPTFTLLHSTHWKTSQPRTNSKRSDAENTTPELFNFLLLWAVPLGPGEGLRVTSSAKDVLTDCIQGARGSPWLRDISPARPCLRSRGPEFQNSSTPTVLISGKTSPLNEFFVCFPGDL